MSFEITVPLCPVYDPRIDQEQSAPPLFVVEWRVFGVNTMPRDGTPFRTRWKIDSWLRIIWIYE